MKATRWLWLVAVVTFGMLGAGCVVETDCTDANANGICDIDEGGCIDDDLDGFCWADDCDDLNAAVGPCSGCIDDMDCDGESDATDCYDDYTNSYVCVDVACTPADNYCTDAWYLVYCDQATSVFYGADCNTSCTTDDRVYGATCGGTPAVSGECGAADGVCVCWCEDSFDSCVAGTETVRYTRDGNTFDVDCKSYCGGTCDENAGACACP